MVRSKNREEPPQTPALEMLEINMSSLVEGRVGVNIVKGQRKISRVLYRDAFLLGWRVGDEIVEVNGKQVVDNDAVQRAVRRAVAAHKRSGAPMRFKVHRWSPRNSGRGMVRMTLGKGVDHMVPMLDLTRGLVEDYPAVLLMEGSLDRPRSRLSARAVALLDDAGAAFKGVDCANETENPGVREAMEELSGQAALPQLFVGGQHIGAGRMLLRRLSSNATELRELLHSAGALSGFRAA